MKPQHIIQLIGILIGITAMYLAWISYGPKLVLILMLAMWSNNMTIKK